MEGKDKDAGVIIKLKQIVFFTAEEIGLGEKAEEPGGVGTTRLPERG